MVSDTIQSHRCGGKIGATKAVIVILKRKAETGQHDFQRNSLSKGSAS